MCGESFQGYVERPNHSALVRRDDSLGAVACSTFHVHVFEVRAHGFERHVERAADLLVRQPAGDEDEQLGLAGCERWIEKPSCSVVAVVKLTSLATETTRCREVPSLNCHRTSRAALQCANCRDRGPMCELP